MNKEKKIPENVKKEDLKHASIFGTSSANFH